ncbi:MAG: OB-fold domain-containing protein [Micromonosporaceae bacterium]|nr:OB-fold domain-containing protein [Micromonosporaceae bacterium]
MANPTSDTAGRLRRRLPRPTAESQPFWDGCARHELLLQRCLPHGHFWFPPANICQRCWSTEYAWTPVCGLAELFTFTVYRRAYAAELADQLPYVVGIVELVEGPRLISNIVGCAPEQVRIGMKLEVVFEDLDDAVTLHAFQPHADRA